MTETHDPKTVAGAHSFGRYRVTKTLGKGAMGEVYEAIDDVLGREVAIKTLRSAGGMSARFIDERFRNEARAIAQFSHPGVVQVFDIDLSANPPFLVMERVAGPALSERVENSGPLAPDEIAPLGIQIARALASAHAAGVVHRDVKPSNVLGAGPGVWKLADFGVAHVPDSSLTMTGQFVGSPAYAAPEALVKGVSAPPGDVYGLGATLYEAAAGKWPRVEAKGALLAPVPPLSQLAPHVPAHVAAAIDRAVSLEAAKRPTASELADMLAHVAVSQPPVAPRALRWQPWAVGGAIVLVIILAIALRGGGSKATTQPALSTPEARPSETLPRPSGLDEKGEHDWDKLLETVDKGDYEKARNKLDEFEDKYGVQDATNNLRMLLSQAPAEQEEAEGPGRGRKKKKR